MKNFLKIFLFCISVTICLFLIKVTHMLLTSRAVVVKLLPASDKEEKDIFELFSDSYKTDLLVSGEFKDIQSATRSAKEGTDLRKKNPSEHRVYVIQDMKTNNKVGYLWWFPRSCLPNQVDSYKKFAHLGFVYILEKYRRSGFMKAAILLTEKESRDLGYVAMSLSVFQFNNPAKALYESLGYKVNDKKCNERKCEMIKELVDDDYRVVGAATY